ncbi:YutD family protein [Caldalkalibacillus salinus]|uniref:YutD family protein n=1 Tax=Caldalkalibacillus salinus TaxID=2803787 RepID=UPI001922AF45|nr:YutD family protein [Caldalkalibacillus salinus]
MIEVQGTEYELLQDERDGWDIEAFQERFSDILSKYDYIVGDWGYSQLRLRGFYDDHNKKAKPAYDAKISTLDEYLQEYCNFGCAYFVLKKIKSAQRQGSNEKPKGKKPEK